MRRAPAAARRVGARSALVFGLLALLSASGAAQPADSAPPAADYLVSNTDWNGLAALHRFEESRGLRLLVGADVDLTTLAAGSALALIYPTSPLPVDDLTAFVARGGRLLVADDYGSAGELMAAFDVGRLPGPAPHRELLRGNEDLPVLRPSSSSPLVRGVRVLVANHPAVLVPSGAVAREPPVIGYDAPGYGLLYDIRFGEGRVIVLGDPSLLINFMRDVGDNAQLATNLFDGLCADVPAPCAVTLVTGASGRVRGGLVARQAGPERDDPEELAESVQRTVERLNEALRGLSDVRPNRRGVYFAALFLGLGICVFLFSALPLGRPRWLSFSIRLPKGVRSRSEFEWNLERLLEGGRNDDFGLPLAILKDEFEDLFMGELAQHPSELMLERRYDAEQLSRFARRFAERVAAESEAPARQAAAGRALSTLRALARIPTRNSLVPEVDGRYSERLLRRLYTETRGLLEELGVLDRYERRAGRP